eukprot:TRINITY_DN66823_c3_g3_i1.p1 TRINITY_DN66823_c3_g3~~TRINITY_DN66823_c3_g3_i1.p1  ORF type:complete len:183 (-),score=56.22 TRINITY_DN66823_c3_g3_i1:803-1351(-)
MGMVFAKLWRRLFGAQQFKICIVGLDNAGKTTTLFKLHLGEVVETHPTIGSNVEEVVHRNVHFQAWDLGGQESIRSSWATYYVNTHAVILVVDSSDRKRVHLVKHELVKLLAHKDLSNAAVLVFANKQDVKGCMAAAEIAQKLQLHTVKDHNWHIQACCALTGDGLYEGLDWVTEQVAKSGS